MLLDIDLDPDQPQPAYVYQTRRLPSSHGYYDIPKVETSLVHQIPPSRSSSGLGIGRVFHIDRRKYYAWSPNSTQVPFYPGPGLLSPRDIPPPSERRFDGHLGPKDPTRNPQFYDPSRPWLPFVEKDPGDEIDPDVAHVQVFKVWKTKDLDGSVGYLDYKFIELLKKMHAREDDRIRNFKRDLYRRNIHREIIDAGIYSTTETDFRSLLTIGYFDAAVDAVKRLQRLLLEKRAWCKLTAAYPYTNSQFNAPEEIVRFAVNSHGVTDSGCRLRD